MQRSNRNWLIAGTLIAVAIFAILAAVASRQSPTIQSNCLGPGESESLRARVVKVLEEGTVDQGDFQQPYQTLRLHISRGSLNGQEIEVEQGLMGLTNQSRMFRAGDRVLVEHTRSLDGTDVFYVTDYVRTGPLIWLAALFVAATLLLSRRQGARSLLGMVLSLAIIAGFIVPRILAGWDPVLVAILGSVVMMGAGLYLVYGWQPKTHVTVVGLFLSLVLTGFLATWFMNWTRLSGLSTEEAGFLQAAGTHLDLQGLLLAGILIGALGVLDDVAIGQSSAVFELSRANTSLSWQALFRHGMVIGRDHIAAMVNTLLLAYVGAALPLLLLFSVNAEPLGMTFNREVIAEEIVRTLVGSLGLLAAVPLTSLIAALVARAIEPGASGADASGANGDSTVGRMTAAHVDHAQWPTAGQG
jgi:uncharacterized membrane protein